MEPNDLTSSVPSPSDNLIEVTWQSAWWVLVPLALNAMLQPSGRVFGLDPSLRTYLRSSPLICAFDTLTILFRFIAYCFFPHLTWPSRAAAKAFAARGVEVDLRGVDHESVQMLEHIPAVRFIGFAFGVLPAAVKLSFCEGIPWTKAWGWMFLGSYIVVEALGWVAAFDETVRREQIALLEEARIRERKRRTSPEPQPLTDLAESEEGLNGTMDYPELQGHSSIAEPEPAMELGRTRSERLDDERKMGEDLERGRQRDRDVPQDTRASHEAILPIFEGKGAQKTPLEENLGHLERLAAILAILLQFGVLGWVDLAVAPPNPNLRKRWIFVLIRMSAHYVVAFLHLSIALPKTPSRRFSYTTRMALAVALFVLPGLIWGAVYYRGLTFSQMYFLCSIGISCGVWAMSRWRVAERHVLFFWGEMKRERKFLNVVAFDFFCRMVFFSAFYYARCYDPAGTKKPAWLDYWG